VFEREIQAAVRFRGICDALGKLERRRHDISLECRERRVQRDSLLMTSPAGGDATGDEARLESETRIMVGVDGHSVF
jgi:hypothetical protein